MLIQNRLLLASLLVGAAAGGKESFPPPEYDDEASLGTPRRQLPGGDKKFKFNFHKQGGKQKEIKVQKDKGKGKFKITYVKDSAPSDSWSGDHHPTQDPTESPIWKGDSHDKSWSGDSWSGDHHPTSSPTDSPIWKGDSHDKSWSGDAWSGDHHPTSSPTDSPIWKGDSHDKSWSGDAWSGDHHPTQDPTKSPVWDGDSHSWSGDEYSSGSPDTSWRKWRKKNFGDGDKCSDRDKCCEQHESLSRKARDAVCDALGCNIKKCAKRGYSWGSGDHHKSGDDWSGDGHPTSSPVWHGDSHDGGYSKDDYDKDSGYSKDYDHDSGYSHDNDYAKRHYGYDSGCGEDERKSCCTQVSTVTKQAKRRVCKELGCKLWSCAKYDYAKDADSGYSAYSGDSNKSGGGGGYGSWDSGEGSILDKMKYLFDKETAEDGEVEHVRETVSTDCVMKDDLDPEDSSVCVLVCTIYDKIKAGDEVVKEEVSVKETDCSGMTRKQLRKAGYNA